MDRNKAFQILSVLAQGTDPVTGRNLPVGGPYNSQDIIHALNLAIEILNKNEGKEKRNGKASFNDDSPEPQAKCFDKSSGTKRHSWLDDEPELDAQQQRLFTELKSWRNEQARNDNVPGYLIFSNITLSRVAHYYPETLDALAKIKGFGDVKIERYSDAILGIVNDFLDASHATAV